MKRNYTRTKFSQCCAIAVFDRTSLTNSMCNKPANLKFSGACSESHATQVKKFASAAALTDYKEAVECISSNPAMLEVAAEMREALAVVAYNAMKVEAERFSAARFRNTPAAIQQTLDNLAVTRTPEVLSNKRRVAELIAFSSQQDKVGTPFLNKIIQTF